MAEFHTQGPWSAEGPDVFGDYNIIPDGQTAAVAAVVSNLRDPIEVAANAILTMAAPTMLKALTYLQGQFEGDGWVVNQDEMARVVRETVKAATVQPRDLARGEC